MKKKTLQGKFYKAANGHNCYEIFSANSEILFEIADVLEARFDCSAVEKPIFGPDTVITSCKKRDTKLLLGWDIWSGFYLMADSADGDELVMEIGHELNSIIGGEEKVDVKLTWKSCKRFD